MAIFEKPPRHHIYLLTTWEERSQAADHPVVWRFRLEDIDMGQQVGFGSLEEMMAFLRKVLDLSETDDTQAGRVI
jgi:hypothetical protein